jgi:threonine dehydratase
MQEAGANSGKEVAVILCGGNIDADWFLTVMQGGVPRV